MSATLWRKSNNIRQFIDLVRSEAGKRVLSDASILYCVQYLYMITNNEHYKYLNKIFILLLSVQKFVMFTKSERGKILNKLIKDKI